VIQIAAYTSGVNAPGARYRVQQMIQPLRARGISMREYPAPFGSYPPSIKPLRPLWGGITVVERLGAALRGRLADMTLLQREMVSTLITVERFTKAPRVADVDDAIWLHNRRTAETLARMCETVVCGNAFLAENFAQWNQNVVVVPTAVDSARFVPGAERVGAELIGWSGTSSGFKFLYQIEPALARVLRAAPGAKLRVISDRQPVFKLLPPAQVEFIRWRPEREVETLQDLSVGIMPLENSDWSRGKCSFKMLTYMACAVPVVASPVGMNSEVFAHGECGLPAETAENWESALLALLDCPEQRRRMGATGRRIVLDHYSTDVISEKLATVLTQVAGAHCNRK
jgi:glycosyltransferase involved in cell wall biosynthesis